jgi:hypothetical protein
MGVSIEIADPPGLGIVANFLEHYRLVVKLVGATLA